MAKFLTKSVEYRFEKKLEIAKAEMGAKEKEIEAHFAAKEKELEHITSFLSSQKRERDSVIQSKRIEAAEAALRVCNLVAKLSMAVEMMKILRIDVLSERVNDTDIQDVFTTILRSMGAEKTLEVLGDTDQTLPTLYLSDHAIAHFDAYKAITIHAIAIMKGLSAGLNIKDLLKQDALRKQVEELVPNSIAKRVLINLLKAMRTTGLSTSLTKH